jgi:hypothetical protein
MGGSVNDPNLAKEWRNPGLQARQPLARPDSQRDSLSSTDTLQSDFFGEGGIGGMLRQALGTDTIPGFDNSGFGGGSYSSGGSSNIGTGGNAPFIATPNTNTQPSFNTSSGSDYSPSFTNSGMGGASNSNNFLSDWASSLDLGGSYNADFFNQPEGLGSSDYFASNNLFNFGNQALGSNIPGIGDFAKANSLANDFGYGNKNVNDAMGVLGLTGNKLFDYAANATGNSYLGMLNDDFSQRGIVNKALRLGDVPYAGGIMTALDYEQGITDWGGIFGTVGGMLLGPFGGIAGTLGGNYFGGKDYNENWAGPSSEWATANGYKQGTEMYDQAVDNYRARDRSGKLTDSQQFFKEDWQNDKFDQQWFEANMLGGRSIDEGVYVPPTSVEEAIADGVPFGNEGDDTWTDGQTTFHSGGYNWNGSSNTGTDSFGNDISGTTDETGATQSDYDSYDSPTESTGNTGGDGTSDSSDDPGGDDADSGGWSW